MSFDIGGKAHFEGNLKFGAEFGLAGKASVGAGLSLGAKVEKNVGGRRDPYLSCFFLVEVQGLIVGGFSDLTGLQAELETEDYQEGGVNGFARKLPKSTRYPNLVLKRGLLDSDILWKWFDEASQGKIQRKTINVFVQDHAGRRMSPEWRFIQAYPVKWAGPDFKADAAQIAIESVEFVHEGIRRE